MSVPRIYDIEIDGWREATQRDLDQFSALRLAYGRLRFAYKTGELGLYEAMKLVHAELMADPAYSGVQRPVEASYHPALEQ